RLAGMLALDFGVGWQRHRQRERADGEQTYNGRTDHRTLLGLTVEVPRATDHWSTEVKISYHARLMLFEIQNSTPYPRTGPDPCGGGGSWGGIDGARAAAAAGGSAARPAHLRRDGGPGGGGPRPCGR